jgi:CheY-like chemotaxis protein
MFRLLSRKNNRMADPIGVLYVEDDLASRMVMEMLLTHMGIPNIQIFENSTDFDTKLDALAFQPTIIFLDIHMQPINGFKMLEVVRSKPQFDGIPVVALTASVMNEEIEQLKTAKFSGVIPKPIAMDAFKDAFQQLLDGQEVWQIVRNSRG